MTEVFKRPIERALRDHIADGSRNPWLTGPRVEVVPGQSYVEDSAGNPSVPPRPRGLYASLLSISDVATSYPESIPTRTGEQRQSCRRENFSVQWIGKGAVGASKKFDLWAFSEYGRMRERDAFLSRDGRPALDEHNIAGFRIIFPIAYSSLTAVIDEVWEERIAANLAVDYIERDTYDIPDVDSVQGGEINYGDLIETVSVTIDS